MPGFQEKSVAAAQPIKTAAWEAAAGAGKTLKSTLMDICFIG
jgi:hypothetical protein